MISYEIALGIAVIGVIMVYGTMDLGELVRSQGYFDRRLDPLLGLRGPAGSFPHFRPLQPWPKTKRLPFDLPEGESEIIGYFVEYSGMKFRDVSSSRTSWRRSWWHAWPPRSFFGGWQVPFLMPDGFHFPWGGEILVSNLVYVLLGVMSFFHQGSDLSAGCSCNCAGPCRGSVMTSS